MTSDQVNSNLMKEIIEGLINQSTDAFRPILETIFNVVMKVEREHFLQAAPYERSEDRLGHANGYKPKKFDTRLGRLELEIPQVRGLGFYPKSLERGSRSEKALKVAIAEMYLQGVSTRRVQKITEKLCGLEITSTQVSRATKELDEQFELFRNRPIGVIKYLTLDATYLKIRHDSTIISRPILLAYGVNGEGKREILGASASLSEAEVHWREFLANLQKRGMNGLCLITSDDHPGLKSARETVLPSVPWQRCQFHLCQNAQAYVPKQSMKSEIAESMRSILNSSTLEMALDRKLQVIKEYKSKAPEFVAWLENNVEEGLTVYKFPYDHRKRIRTSNGMERLNREIKRRTRVAVIFPNKESALRLVTGVIMEVHEEWISGKTYLDMTLLDSWKNKKN